MKMYGVQVWQRKTFLLFFSRLEEKMERRIRDDITGLSILAGGSMPHVEDGPSAKLLEAFPNRFPGRNYVINIYFPEFTSLCPVTGQPDFGAINVDYIPDQLCVESKSFKLYMFAYRDYRSFMETITNNILDDLISTLSPRWCMVKGLFAPRGATRIHVAAEHYKELSPEDSGQVRRVAADVKAQSRHPARL